MPRDHFAQMINSKSHRHDSEHDSEYFNEDMSHLCGMLYSIVTLKAFFPGPPASAKSANPVNDSHGGIEDNPNPL
jgi:hypothetical protein